MAYFAQFPFINYEFPDGIRTIKDLSVRPDFIQRVIDNHSNYEFYRIREGDTPETLAYDYYGDASLHWVIMLANNILNVTSDWPLTTGEFDKFLLNQYRVLDGVTLSDSNVRERVAFKGTVSNIESENFVGSVTQDGVSIPIRPLYFDDADGVKYPLDSATGNVVIITAGTEEITIPVESVSIFERDTEINDAKRNILIVKQRVINDIQTELRNLANG